jgi:hypothetical protein
MTTDVFLASESSASDAVCVSNEGIPDNIYRLARRGVTMSVIFSGESPNVAWDFYHELHKRARPFRHAVIFRGFHPRLPQGVHPHVFRWPNANRYVDGPPWERRAVALMVASPKQRVAVNHARSLSRVAWSWRWLQVHRMQLIDRMLRFPDLYETRMLAIENLASRPGFRVFGWGWPAARQHDRRISRICFNREPKPCDDKLATTSRYRFSLCLENCVYPGYVTEKLFDAMLADTVPVYLGAPDVTDFVPKECFLDLRAFSDWQVLWQRLVTMSQGEWEVYRNAIRCFLASADYRAYDQERVSEQFVELATG